MTQRRSCQACYYDGNNSSYVANIFPANCNKPFDKGVMKRFLLLSTVANVFLL